MPFDDSSEPHRDAGRASGPRRFRCVPRTAGGKIAVAGAGVVVILLAVVLVLMLMHTLTFEPQTSEQYGKALDIPHTGSAPVPTGELRTG